MSTADLVTIVDALVWKHAGRHLSDVETAVLRGAIADQTYEQISEASGYSISYLRRDVGPKFWRVLSRVLGEPVSKTNFRLALERYQQQSPVLALESAPVLIPAIDRANSTPPISDVSDRPLPWPENAERHLDLYVERSPIESICYEMLMQPGALIRIKAPSLMGKTLLLNRLLAQMTQQHYRAVYLSFELADRNSHFTNLNRLMRWFCSNLSRELKVQNQLNEYWDEDGIGAKMSCTSYFEECLLTQSETPLVLLLDNVDLLFPYPEVCEDFFGLLRSWYEKARSRPYWKQLRLVLAHATDVYVRLNIHHSPFNVGVPIELAEFTVEQVAMMARQHGLDSKPALTKPLVDLVGGHPYLLAQAFSYLKNNPSVSVQGLVTSATAEGGIYSAHLRMLWLNLQNQPNLMAAFKQIIAEPGAVQLEPMVTYQLQQMGLIKFVGDKAEARCALYQQYFSRYL